MAKPFVKWAGGKGKLLPVLVNNLPDDFVTHEEVTYIEPFVGGGAMLFHMLSQYGNIVRVVINDINPALINCYRMIRNHCDGLLGELSQLQTSFYELETHDERKQWYYTRRDEYNRIPVHERNNLRSAALFIFFNKTCFNGLYRENSMGNFNVPFGRYVHPTICNEQVLLDVHEALRNVETMHGDYNDIVRVVDWNEYNFFYFDPPYRPLLGASNFRQYTLNDFGDTEQERLKEFCDFVNINGGRFMLSNSDSEMEPGVSYFEHLYNGYDILHIRAPRTINAFVPGVEMTTEILVKNY